MPTTIAVPTRHALLHSHSTTMLKTACCDSLLASCVRNRMTMSHVLPSYPGSAHCNVLLLARPVNATSLLHAYQQALKITFWRQGQAAVIPGQLDIPFRHRPDLGGEGAKIHDAALPCDSAFASTPASCASEAAGLVDGISSSGVPAQSGDDHQAAQPPMRAASPFAAESLASAGSAVSLGSSVSADELQVCCTFTWLKGICVPLRRNPANAHDVRVVT
jgi:hypothetical protein